MLTSFTRWAAPLKAGVHSEQRFHYMAAKGEVRVDQAHRGYSVVEDDVGKLDVSSLYPFPSRGSPPRSWRWRWR